MKNGQIRHVYAFLMMIIFIQADTGTVGGDFRVMFYNVENYFDPFDDAETRDEEFTPGGSRQWTYARFMEKAVKIARVIIACSGPDPPVIVGLAEIENRFVLEKLVYETPLKALGYRIIHRDSPDFRGIDVALLYRQERVRVDTAWWLPVVLGDTAEKTRDILMARCILQEADTLVVAVNHWPSRWGGAVASQERRMLAAQTLKKELDRLFAANPCSNIVVMGDFNDEPGDPSLMCLSERSLRAQGGCRAEMINLMAESASLKRPGTIRHEGNWFFFDQMVVSQAMLKGENGLITLKEKAAVFDAAFLLETDNSHPGMKPFRTFLGPSFHRGFSDHLPVYLDINIH